MFRRWEAKPVRRQVLLERGRGIAEFRSANAASVRLTGAPHSVGRDGMRRTVRGDADSQVRVNIRAADKRRHCVRPHGHRVCGRRESAAHTTLRRSPARIGGIAAAAGLSLRAATTGCATRARISVAAVDGRHNAQTCGGLVRAVKRFKGTEPLIRVPARFKGSVPLTPLQQSLLSAAAAVNPVCGEAPAAAPYR